MKYCSDMMEMFKLNPVPYLTISSFVYDCWKLSSKVKLPFIIDRSIHKAFEMMVSI